MSLKTDFDLVVQTQLQHLEHRLHSGVPSGLPEQIAEVSTIVSTFENQLVKLQQDDGLSQVGQAKQVRIAYDAAQTGVENWRAGNTGGIDQQLSQLRDELLREGNKTVPTPSDLQVGNMVNRLSEFDDLEREVLYLEAPDAERKVIEAASRAVGLQPVKHGDKLAWEPLIKTETMTGAIADRAERANPGGAAMLRDLQEIRNTFEALAGSAKGLLHAVFPSHHEPEPVV